MQHLVLVGCVLTPLIPTAPLLGGAVMTQVQLMGKTEAQGRQRTGEGHSWDLNLTRLGICTLDPCAVFNLVFHGGIIFGTGDADTMVTV